MILVSACLIGINCKYDGNNNENEKVINYLKNKSYIIVCPEQLGGLTTPRLPAEICDGKVLNNENIDVTNSFLKGAYETLKIANIYNCKKAILKEGSPSCGSSFIYDGDFKGNKIKGEGVTTSLLRKNKINVISEKDLWNNVL